MDYISSDLKVIEPIVTCVGEHFVSIENYVSIITYETEEVKVKTKHKVIKIIGKQLNIKYIVEDEMAIVGNINSIEFID